jgi:DNA mismatch repair protein MutL
MSQATIHILPEHIANKIAAGEVVQRPDSVVKELLENSLDAGATRILVAVEDGGKKLMQVADNGTGMGEVDAVAAFGRHATSKLNSYEDLGNIRTFGFRGEALASIASVAQVTMKTRQAGSDAAIVVAIDGGGPPRISHEALEPGTTIAVRNLFYNVPARMKFLKSSVTEFRHIHDTVQRVALSHPGLSLRFVSDGDTVFDVRPADRKGRLIDILGERLAEGVIPVEERTDFLTLTGYIGKPAFGQRTRAHQFLFLNDRPINNRSIVHAVFSAYEHLLTKGTYPFFLLFLAIDPARVDVNVHPSKMEVKFDDEQSIYRFVSTVVRKSLAGGGSIPALSAGDRDGSIGLRFTSRQHHWPDSPGATMTIDRSTGEIQSGFSFRREPPAPQGPPAAIDDLLRGGAQPIAHQPSRDEPSSLIWQVHNKYILSQIKNGLLVVDQHVAHERVLYERALARFENGLDAAQQLLFPVTIACSAGDYALVTELQPHLQRLGFGVSLFGGNTVVIDAVPPDVKVGSERSILEEILGTYREYQQHAPVEVRDNVAKSFACKAAIKAGDRLTENEMRSLIDQLFATSMPYVCPHGRPVVLKISIDELDRRFGRT